MPLEIIQQNAARAAARYKRRCWWTSFEDMEQEAITAQIEAYSRGTFDESFGRPISAYLWSVAMFAVRRLVHKASAPVSASHRTDVLIGVYRDALELTGSEGGTVENPALPREPQATETRMSAQDRARRVRARVVELVGANEAEFAFCVMTHEWRPREIAEESGVSVQVVYKMQRRISNVLIEDPVLYELWKASDR
jgi:DNA-directed RNA polymerase specialized sigma subunit